MSGGVHMCASLVITVSLKAMLDQTYANCLNLSPIFRANYQKIEYILAWYDLDTSHSILDSWTIGNIVEVWLIVLTWSAQNFMERKNNKRRNKRSNQNMSKWLMNNIKARKLKYFWHLKDTLVQKNTISSKIGRQKKDK